MMGLPLAKWPWCSTSPYGLFPNCCSLQKKKPGCPPLQCVLHRWRCSLTHLWFELCQCSFSQYSLLPKTVWDSGGFLLFRLRDFISVRLIAALAATIRMSKMEEAELGRQKAELKRIEAELKTPQPDQSHFLLNT